MCGDNKTETHNSHKGHNIRMYLQTVPYLLGNCL